MLEHKRNDQRDRIIYHLQRKQQTEEVDDQIALTPKDQEKLDRVLTLSALHLEHHYKAATIPIYMRLTGVSKSQAYLDWYDMEHVMGSIERVKKEYLRALYTEWCHEMHAEARAAGDIKTALKAVDVSAKYNMLDKEDPNLPDYSKLKPTQVIIGFFPEFTESEEDMSHKEMDQWVKQLVGNKRDIGLRLQRVAEDVDNIHNDDGTSN